MKTLIILLFVMTFSQLFGLMTPTQVVMIPMRDGKTLAADIYIPNTITNGSTILIQTPYNKNNFRSGLPLGVIQNLNSSNFIWVVVDWRGFYGSNAATIAQPNRGEDGYDVIEWISSQTWSNGKVGTWGPSALGQVQYNTMKEGHPNHVCAVPLVAQPQTAYDSYYYGGVLEKSRLEQLDALGYGLSPVVLANPYDNVSWQYTANTTWYPQNILIPTLQVGGWYDHTIDKMLDWYPATRTQSALAVRDKQWLLVGPWVHGGTGIANVGSSTQGELSYPNAEHKSDSMALDFFNFYLLDSVNNWEATSKITYYQLGENRWNYSNGTTIANSQITDLFLSENGNLISTTGIGSDSFVSDPKNPTPTIGGATLNPNLDQGPYDQVALDSRSDLKTFETTALASDFTSTGNIVANLSIQCNQPDADIAVRLVDVYPDGRNMLINDGIRRMRLRNGYTQASESFLQSTQIYPVNVELPFVNYTWKAGHKIKIYVSANNSTRWDVNLQNGGTMYAAGDTNTATIQIHHNAINPSKITLAGQNLVLGTNELIANDQIHIYPNPAESEIHVSVPFDSYVIYDLKGQLIQSETLINNQSIPIDNLKEGCYLLKIKSLSNDEITRKFVK
ncbi:MAG: CocE/NonD family hydrolase [Fluviicola sp.]|nr:CocE/NonD family hydrolase [Fluviicola sp.]